MQWSIWCVIRCRFHRLIYLVRNGIFHHICYVDGAEQFIARLLKCDCLTGRYFQHDCKTNERKRKTYNEIKCKQTNARARPHASHRYKSRWDFSRTIYHFHWQLCRWELLVTRTSVNRVDLNWQSVPAVERESDKAWETKIYRYIHTKKVLLFSLVIISHGWTERTDGFTHTRALSLSRSHSQTHAAHHRPDIIDASHLKRHHAITQKYIIQIINIHLSFVLLLCAFQLTRNRLPKWIINGRLQSLTHSN